MFGQHSREAASILGFSTIAVLVWVKIIFIPVFCPVIGKERFPNPFPKENVPPTGGMEQRARQFDQPVSRSGK
jgi:hypothetical protein